MVAFVVGRVIDTGDPRPDGSDPALPDVPPYNESGQPRRHPKMLIIAEGRDPFEVPFAPRATSTDGIAPTFTTIDRAGREPLLVRTAGGLEVVTFELILGHRNPNKSVAKALADLRAIAGSGKRMRIKFDSRMAQKRWRLTGFTEQVLGRQHGTNEPTRAVCQFTFTEASDPVVGVGPVSGGHQGGGGGDDKKWPKFYVFKKGDTLHAIARKFYGDPPLWKHIADANKIRDPKKIKVGTKLRIPRPPRGRHDAALGQSSPGPR